MTDQIQKPIIEHEPARHRFTLKHEGHVAVLQYSLKDGVITFTHTGVPAELEGRGLGSQLAKAGLEFARANDYKVVPLCWFVAGYVERHSEYQPLLKS